MCARRLTAAAGLSSAGVAKNLRRTLNRGELREQVLPCGAIGYRIADDRTAQSTSGGEGASGS
jgi:hypothetical protein